MVIRNDKQKNFNFIKIGGVEYAINYESVVYVKGYNLKGEKICKFYSPSKTTTKRLNEWGLNYGERVDESLDFVLEELLVAELVKNLEVEDLQKFLSVKENSILVNGLSEVDNKIIIKI